MNWRVSSFSFDCLEDVLQSWRRCTFAARDAGMEGESFDFSTCGVVKLKPTWCCHLDYFGYPCEVG